VLEAEEMNLDEPGTSTMKRDSSNYNMDNQEEMGFDSANLQPIYDKDGQIEFCHKFKDNIYS
jgi:hypothetical protein